MGQLAAYSIRQDAALEVCNGRREAVVAIVDAARPVKRWKWF